MKIKKLHTKLFGNIKTAVVSDNLRRRLLFYFLNAALSLTSFIMTIINLFTKEYILMFATFLFAVLCLLNILLLYFSKIKEKTIYYIFAFEAMMLLAFFFISGIPDGFSALWICLIPSFALLIFGVKSGSVFSLLALLMMIFLFWIPSGRALLMYHYTSTFMLRFPFLYSSIYLISLLIELVRRETQRQLEKAKQEYQHLYRHDALTGLYNRYGIKEYLANIFNGNIKQHISVILFDIDNFKNINDVYGHECGDIVLKTISNIPLRLMCKHCHFCRWGGEEFLLIMQCEHDASVIAEKIRKEVENTPIDYNGTVIHVTISIGVCIIEDISGMTVHDVIEQADKAMYQSKNNGKNRVTVKIIN